MDFCKFECPAPLPSKVRGEVGDISDAHWKTQQHESNLDHVNVSLFQAALSLFSPPSVLVLLIFQRSVTTRRKGPLVNERK